MKKSEITLNQTCGACPEQYDAIYDGKVIGYLRLRHGYFTVSYPDSGGKQVYASNTIGDGVFDSDERDYYLNKAKKALKKEYNKKHK